MRAKKFETMVEVLEQVDVSKCQVCWNSVGIVECMSGDKLCYFSPLLHACTVVFASFR